MPQLPNYDEDQHQAVSAWFLGPRAENFRYLELVLNTVLQEQGRARADYYPNDPLFITPAMQESFAFQREIYFLYVFEEALNAFRIDQINKLAFGVQKFAENLSDHHVPFWNPRYNGHMLNDTTLPGIAGYLTAMLFNPNNVAAEASPLTTSTEYKVGQQLCKMVGYKIKSEPKPWGHITCDGSVANLESMWAARNLKFYPLSLVLAMEKDQPLDFIADSFKVPTCTGTSKLLRDFTTWELLNIAPEDVLDIPTRLYKQYSFSSAFLENALKPFNIQSASKDSTMFAKKFGLERINNIAYLTSATKHYSWPKGAAITGIGESNLINVTVDDGARMKIQALRDELDKCIKEERAVYAIVAIMGSTEHGACDPLEEIVAIRREYREKGLSFALHADAAWGGYFCTTLLDDQGIGGPAEDHHFVPSIALKDSTQKGLRCLSVCDSVTVDPHKSGYIQYPAGGLLYRDERMRYLVSWTSPVVNRSGEKNMGVYGVEGSKPGAAPVAAFLSHEVIGLNPKGYGALLGEAVFGCAIMYAHLVTMSTDDSNFIVTPLNLLPAELKGKDVEDQKKYIRKHILGVRNEDLVQDEEAMYLVKEMGSDLSINAFAVNFKLDGKPNDDVILANDLNRRIFERLSVVSPEDGPKDKPLFLTSTKFSYKNYGDCLKTYKRRLGLAQDTEQDLYSLINVVMSPFPTTLDFTKTIIEDLQTVIEEEVATSIQWNTVSPDTHGFIMQGTEVLYLVHIPMFNMASHRSQLIITGYLPPDAMEKYTRARKEDPTQLFTLANAEPSTLENMVSQRTFTVNIFKGVPPSPDSSLFIPNVTLSNVQIVVRRQLDSKNLTTTYPRSTMPFYLYGLTSNSYHIDHVLLASPNIQLTADQVHLSHQLASIGPTEHVYAHVLDKPELAMQPFPDNETIKDNYADFFFKPKTEFEVRITEDVEGLKEIVPRATLTLGNVAFFDTNELNMMPGKKGPRHLWEKWGHVIDSIGEGMKNSSLHVGFKHVELSNGLRGA
ncbi:hypothetical protein VNI00_003851 [Paramarasmius palmivorus]|uniref:PLP-dependent transferase n=1 Tax=Paramarasmius palmivorus TaxID=297713 RepID=A0AAW0DMR9_9AGAR